MNVTRPVRIQACLYCRRSERRIRQANRRAGYRIPCPVRGTPKGFHKFAFLPAGAVS